MDKIKIILIILIIIFIISSIILYKYFKCKRKKKTKKINNILNGIKDNKNNLDSMGFEFQNPELYKQISDILDKYYSKKKSDNTTKYGSKENIISEDEYIRKWEDFNVKFPENIIQILKNKKMPLTEKKTKYNEEIDNIDFSKFDDAVYTNTHKALPEGIKDIISLDKLKDFFIKKQLYNIISPDVDNDFISNAKKIKIVETKPYDFNKDLRDYLAQNNNINDNMLKKLVKYINDYLVSLDPIKSDKIKNNLKSFALIFDNECYTNKYLLSRFKKKPFSILQNNKVKHALMKSVIINYFCINKTKYNEYNDAINIINAVQEFKNVNDAINNTSIGNDLKKFMFKILLQTEYEFKNDNSWEISNNAYDGNTIVQNTPSKISEMVTKRINVKRIKCTAKKLLENINNIINEPIISSKQLTDIWKTINIDSYINVNPEKANSTSIFRNYLNTNFPIKSIIRDKNALYSYNPNCEDKITNIYSTFKTGSGFSMYLGGGSPGPPPPPPGPPPPGMSGPGGVASQTQKFKINDCKVDNYPSMPAMNVIKYLLGSDNLYDGVVLPALPESDANNNITYIQKDYVVIADKILVKELTDKYNDNIKNISKILINCTKDKVSSSQQKLSVLTILANLTGITFEKKSNYKTIDEISKDNNKFITYRNNIETIMKGYGIDNSTQKTIINKINNSFKVVDILETFLSNLPVEDSDLMAFLNKYNDKLAYMYSRKNNKYSDTLLNCLDNECNHIDYIYEQEYTDIEGNKKYFTIPDDKISRKSILDDMGSISDKDLFNLNIILSIKNDNPKHFSKTVKKKIKTVSIHDTWDDIEGDMAYKQYNKGKNVINEVDWENIYNII